MHQSQTATTRFERLSVLGQSCMIVASAVIGADVMTLIFYSIFFADRLLLDLLLTSLIVVVVAFPLSYFFMGRSARIASLVAELNKANRTDDLTGLLNRKTFLLEATRLIDSDAGANGAGALLFIDADHFKSVNDTFGHAVGDAVLCELATVLGASIDEGDLAGRIGGEEFAVFLAGAGQDEAARVCDRIRRGTKAISGNVGLGALGITVSVGASMHRPRQALDSLLMAADRNLYIAKSNGRDRAVQGGEELAAA